jgi:hypothetical protein
MGLFIFIYYYFILFYFSADQADFPKFPSSALEQRRNGKWKQKRTKEKREWSAKYCWNEVMRKCNNEGMKGMKPRDVRNELIRDEVMKWWSDEGTDKGWSDEVVKCWRNEGWRGDGERRRKRLGT